MTSSREPCFQPGSFSQLRTGSRMCTAVAKSPPGKSSLAWCAGSCW